MVIKKKIKQTLNREISWLYFNDRVLQEAADETTPLIERFRFLGIFSNNLDEFYRVRVATLRRVINVANRQKYHSDVSTHPQNILNKINEIILRQSKKFAEIYDNIVENLEKYNIHIVRDTELTEEHSIFVKRYFKEKVRPLLFPIMIENLKNLSLKDKSIYLAVVLSNKDSNKKLYSILKIPATALPRFTVLPEIDKHRYVILLDDIIRHCFSDLFHSLDYDTFNAYNIKLTRDAEMDIDNDISKSMIERISMSLKQRQIAGLIRFVYDKAIPVDFLKQLLSKLKIVKTDNLIAGGRYHNFKDFINFPNFNNTNIIYEKIEHLVHKDLVNAKSLFNVIKEKDILLYYPFQSFNYIIDLLREASFDPKVKSIKITLYRLAKDSNIINALINAARNGKEVTVFIELQARFDEEANINYSEKLKEEGVKLIFSNPGLKVHCKLILIKRIESGKTVYYSNISTGNYNEVTSKLYCDFSLLTTNVEITADVRKIFEVFDNNYKPTRFKHLIVSPFYMRNSFVKLINNEIANAKNGLEAQIVLKLNNLVDEKIIEKLYMASQAGVKVKLIVRGICVLKPGVRGVSDNIEGISIIDKFLEHARIAIFHNNGDELFYMSSADWMVRNFDHRIEIACPVYDPQIKKEIKDIIDIQLQDNTKARIITNNEENKYKQGELNQPKVRSQVEIYKYLKNIHHNPYI